MNIGMTALRNGVAVLRTRKYTSKDEAEASGFAAELERTAAWRDTASVSASKPASAPEPADPNAILSTDSVQVKLEKLQKIAETADYTGMSYEEIYCAIWDRYQTAFDGILPAARLIRGEEWGAINNQFGKEVNRVVYYPLFREVEAETGLRHGTQEFSDYWRENCNYGIKFSSAALGYGGMTAEEKERAIAEKYAGKNTIFDFASMIGEMERTGVFDEKMDKLAVFSMVNMISRELVYKVFPESIYDCEGWPTDDEWAAVMYQPFDARGFVQGVKKAVQTQYHFENWDFDIQGVLDSAFDGLLSILDKSVENAHAAVERAVQAGLEQSGYMKFGDRMIPLNIM